MNMDNTGAPQHHAEHLDADAVCAQCGTVNAEGTLICKVCGNNLRDQRHNRMMAEQQIDHIEGEPKLQLRFLTGALVVLGALMVVWVAINANNIAEGMVESQLPGSSTVLNAQLWEGPGAQVFEDLRGLLNSSPITQAQIVAAQDQVYQGQSATGRYILVGNNTLPGMSAGRAYVQEDGEELLVVAELNGGIQMRGRARLRNAGEQSAWVIDDLSGSATDGVYFYQTYGVAVADANGSLQIVGMANGEYEVSAVAYRLPN